MKKFLCAIGLTCFSAALAGNPERWVTYYSDKAKIDDFAPYSLLALDSHYHPPLKPLQAQGKELLGYISLGEAENNRPFFHEVKAEGILLQENDSWPGSFFVDMRDERWSKRVLESLIPEILNQGFDGIMIDTLDNPGELEEADPIKYKGVVDAAVDLVKRIRQKFPDIKIMVNRGYNLLPRIANDIDYELGECVVGDYNFVDKTYFLVPQEEKDYQVDLLKKAQAINPKLKVYTLDYWYKEDPRTIKMIYDTQRKNGFIPYVATVDLHSIIEEP